MKTTQNNQNVTGRNFNRLVDVSKLLTIEAPKNHELSLQDEQISETIKDIIEF